MTEQQAAGPGENVGASECQRIVEHIPAELRDLRRWVAWRREQRKPDAKPTKVPINPHTGKRASTTDERTWGTFDEATARMRADHLDGVGFVFKKGDGYVGTDLDGCRNPETGAIEPWARKIIEKLASYTEVSPSRRGVHVISRGSLPPEGRRKGPIEMYEEGRYFTVTGARLEGTPADVAERTAELSAVHAEVFGVAMDAAPEPESEPERGAPPPSDLDDDQVIERASAAKNGAKFDALWRGDASGYVSGSEADLALCGMLAFWTGGSAERVDQLFRRSKLMRPKWDQLRGQKTYGQRTIAKALAGRSTFYSPHVADGEGHVSHECDKRKTVWLVPSQMPVSIDITERALRESKGTQIYQRGTMLVRVARLEHRETNGRVTRWRNAPLIEPVDVPYLCDRLGRDVCFMRQTEDLGYVPADCPSELAKQYLSRKGQWHLPRLDGVQQAPTILADGKIRSIEGYDAESRMLFDFGGAKFPAISERPSSAEVKRALQVLLDLLAEFPFVAPVDRSVQLASMFTGCARPAFAAAPGFGTTAPEMATGKSLLANLPAYIATGRRAAAMSQSPDENEERKRIFALLMGGAQFGLVDNIVRPVESPALASAITEDYFQDRVLGKSETGTVPTSSTTWLLTGNNLSVCGDLRTRVLVTRVDAGVARPWERRFKVDIRRALRERRGEYVWAILTILRAHAVAGWPEMGLEPFGRFEDWSRVVRSALVWIGQPDPLGVLARLEEADPHVQALARLQHAWGLALGEGVATAREWIGAAGYETEAANILTELAAGKLGKPDAVRLGKLLCEHEGRVHGGRRFERAGSHAGSLRWRRAVIPPSGGGGGDGGVVPNPNAEGDSGGVRADAHVPAHPRDGAVGTHPTTPTIPTQRAESPVRDRESKRTPRGRAEARAHVGEVAQTRHGVTGVIDEPAEDLPKGVGEV